MTLLHQQVYQLYFNQGKTQREIAEELCISRTKIIAMFKKREWKSRPAKPRREEADSNEVYRLYFEEGLSQREVAEKLGLSSVSPVQRIFKENEWRTRGRWRNGATYDRRYFSTEEEREGAVKERSKRRQADLKELRQNLFGTECKICGKSSHENLLAIHRKDFKEHGQNMLWIKSNLESVNPEEWVSLCVACHRGVHWLRGMFDFDWEDIEQYLARKRKIASYTPVPFVLTNNYKTPQEHRRNGKNIIQLRKTLFGENCALCKDSDNRRLVIHRKDGKSHHWKLLWSERNLRLLDSNEWVLLCQKCHRYVHWAMNNLSLKWKDFE